MIKLYSIILAIALMGCFSSNDDRDQGPLICEPFPVDSTGLIVADVIDYFESDTSHIQLKTQTSDRKFKVTNTDGVLLYKIKITEPGLLRVEVSDVPSSVRLVLALLDDELVSQQKITGELGADLAVYDNVELGTYYISISNYVTSQTSDKVISLNLSMDSVDIHEYNDQVNAAASINLNEEYWTKVIPRGDIDLFSFSLTEETIIDIIVDSMSSKLHTKVRILDHEEEALFQAYEGTVDSVKYTVVLPKGDYFFETSDNLNQNWSDKAYRFELREYKDDLNEPNNQWEDAGKIDFDKVVLGTIYPKQDKDLYEVNVAQDDTLTVDVKNPSNAMRYEVSLYNDLGQKYTSHVGVEGDDFHWDFSVKAGKYYVEVGNFLNANESKSQYELSVSIQGNL